MICQRSHRVVVARSAAVVAVCLMRLLILSSVLLVLVGCVKPLEPTRDYHCFYPHDTVGYIEFHNPSNIITDCTFFVQKQIECNDAIDSRQLFHAKDCFVGKKAG